LAPLWVPSPFFGKGKKKNLMRTALIVGLVAAAALSQAQIAQWNFNSNPADSSTGTGSITPSVGSGSLSLVGGATTSFQSGVGSSDPAAADNSAYNTLNYPAQSVGSGTAGVQFNVSTVGFLNIQVQFDRRHSATASRWVQLQYSTNGTTFVPFQNYEVSGTNVAMINGSSANLSSISGVNNNPNFAIRLVTIFGTVGSAGGSVYTSVGNTSTGPGGSTYGPAGTIRYDMVTVSGQPVPEPGTMAALGLGAAALLRRRRNK